MSQENKADLPSNHNYFSELVKKLRTWKAILKETRRIEIFAKKYNSIDLSGTQDEVLKYIIEFDSKEGKLLSSSETIQKLYVELQELLNQEGNSIKVFDNHTKKYWENFMNDLDCTLFVERIDQLFQDRKRQKSRILCIKALLKHEKKQFQLETKLKNESFRRREEAFSEPNANEGPFELIPTEFEQSIINRIRELRKRILKDEKEIRRIEQSLQKRAQWFLQEGNRIFSEDIENNFINECREIYPKLNKALLSDYKLKKKLQLAFAQFKTAIEQEKVAQTKANQPSKVPEKTIKEKIQIGFDHALSNNCNLILIGKERSLGLTNSVIKGINEDTEYKQDIIEYIQGLLDTPQGQDFCKGGNRRWKPVINSNFLYELSINPKTGHSSTMPRFYAKKEIFSQNSNILELTNNKDKREKNGIWVIVRKGVKKDQANDIIMAGKVFFKNDGELHEGQISLNELNWTSINLNPTPNIPHKKIGRINSIRAPHSK